MTSRRLRAGIVCAVSAGAALNFASPAPVRADDKDGDVVYCLSGAQRAGLVESAVILRLAGTALPGAAGAASAPPVLSASARPGAPGSLETWRAADAAAFGRACAALIAADQLSVAPRSSGPGPIRNMLTVLLPAAVGALLSWAFATQLAARNARRVQAAALRSAKKQFDRDAQSIIDGRAAGGRGPMPAVDALRVARIDLVNQLEEVAALHRGWTEPGEVRTLLDGEKLAETIEAVEVDEPAGRVEEARSMVRELMGRVEAVAVAVERPWRGRDVMRPGAGSGVVP